MSSTRRSRKGLFVVIRAARPWSVWIFFATIISFVRWIHHDQDTPSSALSLSFEAVDKILEMALSTALIREIKVDASGPAVEHIQTLQESLKCFVERGTWTTTNTLLPSESPQNSKGFSVLKTPIYIPGKSCFPSADPHVCSLLPAKKILMVGPETTFHLHSLWLRSLEIHEQRSHTCLGPEFCTFHHICQPPAPNLMDVDTAVSLERNKKLPRESDLVASGSAILRYIQSTSLLASPDPGADAYVLSRIDPVTGVREKNVYWQNQARRADVVIMNRGPIPAPASTWTGDAAGNWSFVEQVPLELPDSAFSGFGGSIINAAVHVTIRTFLPDILRTLHTIQTDPAIRSKTLIWHGSWYMLPDCSRGEQSATENIFNVATDPWSLYYNTQGQLLIYRNVE